MTAGYPSPLKVREALTPQLIQTLHILQAALAAGVGIFGAVVVYLGMAGSIDASLDVPVSLLSGLNAAVFLVGFSLASWASAKVLLAGDPSGKSIGDWIAGIRSGWIVNVAIREIAAVTSVAITMVMIFAGVLPDQFIYWLNLVPAGVFIWQCATELPDLDGLVRFYKDRSSTAEK